MTREEAIESLRGILTEAVEFENSVCYVTEEDREPLEMAIQALEQESCENWCGVPSDEMTLEQARQAVKDLRKKLIEHLDQGSCTDAISRQAVLDKKELVELEDGQSFYCISPEDVETLPSVNPQSKTGHWIFDEILDKHYYCSECKSMGVDYWDFCPYCGARMIELQESENK